LNMQFLDEMEAILDEMSLLCYFYENILIFAKK
jgi:hypothetical protein